MSILAIDLGGTTVKLGRVKNGSVVARGALASHSESGVGELLSRLAESVSSICTADCTQIAMSFPTLVDVKRQRVVSPMQDKFSDLCNIDIHQWCRDQFGLPLKIENDAHAALLGEWKHGSAVGIDDVVMLTLGTGIGSSVILGGRPLRGATGQTGNLCGHLVMDPNGPSCGCGGRGCYEAMQHLKYIRELAKQDPDYSISDLARRGNLDYQQLFTSAAGGDALATRLRDRSIDIWGALAISVIHAFDPQKVVVGGGIIRAGPALIEGLKSRIATAWTPTHAVEIVPALLGDDAALIGLEVLCQSNLEYL